MKRLVLISVLALSACETIPVANEQPTRSVNVMQRSWAVTQIAEEPVTYKAVRDNNNLNPFGPPPALRTTQAIRAIETATGCRVIRSSMYQNMSADFYAQVSCN